MAEKLTFDEYINHWADERPEDCALQEDDVTFSYAQLDQRTRKIITVLTDYGIGKGDRVAWLGKNSQLYFSLFYACARLGVVMVPIGWRLAPAEMAYIAQDTGAKLMVAGHAFEDTAPKVAELIEQDIQLINQDEMEKLIAASAPAEFAPAGPDDDVLQLYTSGTTGNPKGAVNTNRNFFGLRGPAEEADLPYSNTERHETILVCMPCAHIGGTGLGVLALAGGARGLVQAEFEPGQVLEAIEQGVTRLFIVPAALQMVIQHPNAATTDFSGLKYVLYGAAPIPLELLKQAVETMPEAGFIQAYGMTETTGTVCMLPPEDHDLNGNERMRSAGKALPGVKVKVVDEQGNELPRGEIGELVVHSPSNMSGYWNLPEATASSLVDGWMHTGDAATMDEDGYVYIQDRIKDMIISGGENVYPAEVESAIYGHPAIAEVAVIGVPDDKWGEAVKAVIARKPGEELSEDDLIAFAREKVAAFKVPKSVDFIDALPRNASGKILRKDLRAPYWEGRERQVN